MGRQSSRMIYKGKDIKDFYCCGIFLGKLYKGNTLVWEKLYPDECLITNRNEDGILIFDMKNRFFDIMPYGIRYGEGVIDELSCVGNSLFSVLKPIAEESYMACKSSDLENFVQMPEIEYDGANIFGMTNAYTDNECLFSRINETDGITVVAYGNDKMTIYKAGSYSNHERFVKAATGKGPHLTCIGYDDNEQANIIYKINDKAEVVSRTLFRNNQNIQTDEYFRVGETVYVTGQPRYDRNTIAIGRINAGSGVIDWDKDNLLPHRQTSNVNMVRPASVNEEEIIAVIHDTDSEDRIILSFKENGWSVVNTVRGGYVTVRSVDGESVQCYIESVYMGAGVSEGYELVTVGSHAIYVKDKKPVHDDGSHGLLFNAYGRAFYFDNPYFMESDGNICSVLLY